MKAATKAIKAKPASRNGGRRADRTVPFDEMQRLMRVYGPIKCLRKRQPSGNAANAKIDSVKRKFYRWFPDLDERFFKDSAGFYRPRFGHEFEMKYREEMRARDGECLSRKRNARRIQRLGGRHEVRNANDRRAGAAPCIPSDARTAPVQTNRALISPGCSPVVHHGLDHEVPTSNHDNIRLDVENDRTASMSIIEDAEPLDGSFIAERGIFDDVERNFFGPNDMPVKRDQPSLPLLPLVSDSSSLGESAHEEEPCPSPSWESDESSVVGMLEKTMEEYCAEILSDDTFHFDEL